jgi:GNAT superfamily N-acetyltransferase
MSKIQNVTIRTAKRSDAKALALLSTALGYPATAAQMKARLAHFNSDPMHGIFVAESDDVDGWIQIAKVATLESGTFAEILGLVVAEPRQGQGIGTQLVSAAESWAKRKKCSRIRVRTNRVRVQAQKFYKKLGYELKKTQDVFDKNIRA